MSQNLKPEERELVKLVGFFKKKAEMLISENKMSEDYRQMIETCDKLVSQLELHAQNREIILAEREQLKSLVKDNAKCPKCESNTNLKTVGVDKNEKGWKSNKYKCRKCNIEFVWSAPNNPWDMIPYVEGFVDNLEKKAQEEPDESLKQNTLDVLNLMKANLAKLKPVVEASDLDLAELEAREAEMSNMVHTVKKHLLIEKIRMED
jgi:hypothetical protein